jgi:hypothetical protein
MTRERNSSRQTDPAPCSASRQDHPLPKPAVIHSPAPALHDLLDSASSMTRNIGSIVFILPCPQFLSIAAIWRLCDEPSSRASERRPNSRHPAVKVPSLPCRRSTKILPDLGRISPPAHCGWPTDTCSRRPQYREPRSRSSPEIGVNRLRNAVRRRPSMCAPVSSPP